jgi:hypothetical protein
LELESHLGVASVSTGQSWVRASFDGLDVFLPPLLFLDFRRFFGLEEVPSVKLSSTLGRLSFHRLMYDSDD